MWILLSKHKAYEHEDHDSIRRSKEFERYLDAAQREPVIVTKKSRPVAVTVSLDDWEELTSFRVEQGIKSGLADIEAGRFEEMLPNSTEARIARFKTRSRS